MMQKTYLSRALTRAMALDHPIGDPTGGPAYGEKNEPISAVMAGMSMGGTFTAMMAGNVMAGVAFAGAAVSLIGMVTGNKTLTQVGAVAGLIGGAGMAGLFGKGVQTATWGSLGGSSAASSGAAAVPAAPLSQTAAPGAQAPVANGTMIESSAAPTAPVNGVAPGAGAPGTALGVSYIPAPGEALTASQTNANILNSPLMTQGSGLQGLGSLGPATSPLSMSNIATAPLSGSQAATSRFPLADEALAMRDAPAQNEIANLSRPGQEGYGWKYFGETDNNLPVAISPDGKYYVQNGEGMQKVTGAGGGPLSFGEKAWDKLKGLGSDFMQLSKDNPAGANILAKTAGGIADWLTGKTDAELDALKAQAGLYGARGEQIRFEIQREKDRRARLNAGYQQVNQGIPVNTGGTAAPPWVNAPGLINGARN